METNLYTMTVPGFIRTLKALRANLVKAQTHVVSKVNPAVNESALEAALLSSRLVFDQFPLIRQIQVACDNAKNGIARIAGVEAPKFEDKETTFADLLVRIDDTVAFLESIDSKTMIGKEETHVGNPYWGGKEMYAYDYVTSYLVPNFYFHATTAYSIMRSNGVALGKSDYFGELKFI